MLDKRFRGVCARAGFAGLAIATLVGCSSTASAGSLSDSMQERSQVVGQGTTSTEDARDSVPSAIAEAEGTQSQGSRTSGSAERVSPGRRSAVSAAVARFVATLPNATLISTDVLDEGSRSSTAVATVVRSGSRQLLAISVREREGAWVVENIDTMPTAQDLR